MNKAKYEKGVIPEVIDEIMSIAARTDENVGSHIMRIEEDYVYGSDGYVALALSRDEFPCTEERYVKPEKSFWRDLNLGFSVGNVRANTLRTDVMSAIGSFVNLEKAGCAYEKFLNDEKNLFMFGGYYVDLKFMHRATILMSLAGMDKVDVFFKDMHFAFVASRNCKVQAILLVMAYKVIGSEDIDFTICKVRGSSVIQSNNDGLSLSNEDLSVDKTVISEHLASYKNFLLKKEEDAKRYRKIYAVDLIMSHTYYVVANNPKEAGRIAMNEASGSDFDDEFEVDYCTEKSPKDVVSETIYSEDGEIDLDDFLNEQ